MTGAATRTSIASDSAYSLGLRVCLYMTGFAASILISRVLGPGGRGLYYLPVVTAATLCAFLSLGFEQANVFLFGNRRASIGQLWAQAGLVAAVMGCAGVTLAVASPLVLPRLYAQTPILLLALSGLTIPFTLHGLFAAGLLTLQGRVTRQFRAGLAAAIVQLATLSALFFTGRLGVTSVLVTTLVTSIVNWLLMATRVVPRGARWVEWDRGLFADTVRQALPLHLGSIFLFLHLRLDMFMVSGMVGAAALGIYSLAVTLAETVQLATDSLSLSLLPRQVGNTVAQASDLSLRGARANALVGGTLALGWVALGVPVIRFAFGREFGPSYLPLVVLLPGIICMGMQRACGGAVLRSGHPWRMTAIQAASLMCNAALNVWLIPALGVPGAALASTLSYATGATIFLVWTSHLASMPVRRGILPGAADFRSLWTAAARMISARSSAADAGV